MKQSKFMSNVYLLMAIGLIVTGFFGYTFGNSPELISTIVDESGFTILGWVALLSPMLLVFVIPFVMDRLGSGLGMCLFILFSMFEGLSLSIIFLIYTEASILLTFGVTSLTFLTMSIIGYTTKMDLTKMGSILMMVVIGLIIAIIVNMFLNSEVMDYIISGIGVIVFTGLIAYDTQKLKNLSIDITDTESLRRISVMGALSLYLDFVNLFLFLLRFLGQKK